MPNQIKPFFFPKDREDRVIQLILAPSGATGEASAGTKSHIELRIQSRFVLESDLKDFWEAPLRVEKQVLSKEDSIGETYTLVSSNPRVRKKLVLKMPHVDVSSAEKANFPVSEFHRIQRHFEDESSSLKALAQSSDSELRSIGTPQIEGKIARVFATGVLHWRPSPRTPSDRAILVPVLLEEHIRGHDLQTIIKTKKYRDAHLSERWISLAYALTNIVRRLHNRGIIHGSIHPRHVIVEEWRIPTKLSVSLVGFGTSALFYDMSPDHRERVKEKLELQAYAAPELKAAGAFYGLFSFPIDIYSLGMVLYSFAVGGIDSAMRLPTRKRSLQHRIAQELKGAGVHIESISRVIDKCLRFEAGDRFTCADEILDFILNAASPGQRPNLLRAVYKEISDVESDTNLLTAKVIPRKNAPLKALFGDLVRRALLNQGLSARNKHCEFYGARDEILNHVCAFLATLGPGDTWYTVTLPAYWTDDNLGAYGRFLVKNKDAASSGVIINRVFLVEQGQTFDRLPLEEQQILWNQFQAQEEIAGSKNDRSLFSVRIAEVDSSEIRNIEQRHNLVAFVEWADAARPSLGLSFLSRGTLRQEYDKDFWTLKICKVRFKEVDGSMIGEFKNTFLRRWEGARTKPIGEYIGKLPRPFTEVLKIKKAPRAP